MKPGDSWTEQEEEITKHVEGMLGENKVDAILCVAGGWAGGNASAKSKDMYTTTALVHCYLNKNQCHISPDKE